MGGAYHHRNYRYDSFGNLTSSDGSGSVPLDPTGVYGANNRLQASQVLCVGHAGETGGYDAAGNQLCRGNNSAMEQDQYGWDGDNRIVSVWKQWHNTPNLTTYATYDGLGQRMRMDRVSPGQTAPEYRQYDVFNGQVLADEDTSEGWTRYIYAGGRKVAWQRTPWGGGWRSRFLRFTGTAGTNAGQYNSIGVSGSYAANGYTLQAGDQLWWRQRQTDNGHGGLILLVSSQTGLQIRNPTDTAGQYAASDNVTPPGQWVTRTANIGTWAGDVLNRVDFGAGLPSSGTFSIDFSDIAILSTNGDVHTVFNGQSVPTVKDIGNSAMTNVSATVILDNIDSDPTHYFMADHLGSAQMEFNAAGYPVWKGEYDPFGQELDPGLTSNRYKFTGKERDSESGLDYFGARYYSSNMGRWMSPDWSAQAEPVPYAKLGDPQSLNIYSYMQNNPLGGVDADGHWPDWLKSAATGAGKWIANQVTGNNVMLSHRCTACGEATGVMNMAGQNTAIYQSPSNTAEAVGYYGTGAAQVASAVVLPEYGGSVTVTAEEGISDAALAGRANAIQAAQDTFGQTKSTTAAASVTDANGNTSVMIGSSRNALTPSQRAALQPGDTAVTGSGHAETTVINAAKSQGMTVNSVAASRPICSTCAQAIQDAGARPATPLKQP